MPMIETINLTKRYGDLVALDNLNLSIEEGDCYGFIGPNGAGKTTTIKILATLLKPSSGQAQVAGLTVGYQNRLIRPQIGYVPDFMGAYEDMVVMEYLEFFAAAYNIHGMQRRKVVRDVLELTDLGFKPTAAVNGLSRGMRQRPGLARVRAQQRGRRRAVGRREPSLSALDKCAMSTAVRGDNRSSVGGRLHNRQRETFNMRRSDHAVGTRVNVAQLFVGKRNAKLDDGFARRRFTQAE